MIFRIYKELKEIKIYTNLKLLYINLQYEQQREMSVLDPLSGPSKNLVSETGSAVDGSLLNLAYMLQVMGVFLDIGNPHMNFSGMTLLPHEAGLRSRILHFENHTFSAGYGWNWSTIGAEFVEFKKVMQMAEDAVGQKTFSHVLPRVLEQVISMCTRMEEDGVLFPKGLQTPAERLHAFLANPELTRLTLEPLH